VRQVLDARLAQLSPPARSVIELAAVVGRAFTFGVLAAAGDLGEESLVAALDEGWRRRIIREQGADAYDFSHEKLREAAYAGLSRTRRRWLHGQVARALEQLHVGDLDAAAGVLAGHWETAGQHAQASAYYGRAAARARRLYAHADALAALEKALNLTAAARADMTARLQEELGDLQEILTQHGRARDAYAAALAATPASDAIAQARLHRKVGKSLESERAGFDPAASRYATAETLLGPPDEGAEAALWEEWCQVQIERLLLMYWWNRPDEMAAQLQRVQPAIERHGTPLQRAALFGHLSRHLNRSGCYAPSDAALAYARAALAALPPASSPETLAPYQFGLGFNLLWHGEPAEAQAALSAALVLAEQTGDITLQARCLAYLAVTHRRQGDAVAVGEVARRGLVVAEAAGMFDYIGAGRANLAWLAWQQGSASTPLSAGHAEAERLGEAALEAWRRHPAPYPLCWQALWPLIGVTLAQARPAAAIAFTRQLLDPAQQALPPAVEQPLAAALAAWNAGQPDAAHDLLSQALDLAQQANLS
jgi:tetratricopeptide (TPR) repeat protein